MHQLQCLNTQNTIKLTNQHKTVCTIQKQTEMLQISSLLTQVQVLKAYFNNKLLTKSQQQTKDEKMRELSVNNFDLYTYVKCIENGLYNQLTAYKLISTNRIQKGWLPGTCKSFLLFITIAITLLSGLPCFRQYLRMLPPCFQFISTTIQQYFLSLPNCSLPISILYFIKQQIISYLCRKEEEIIVHNLNKFTSNYHTRSDMDEDLASAALHLTQCQFTKYRVKRAILKSSKKQNHNIFKKLLKKLKQNFDNLIQFILFKIIKLKKIETECESHIVNLANNDINDVMNIILTLNLQNIIKQPITLAIKYYISQKKQQINSYNKKIVNLFSFNICILSITFSKQIIINYGNNIKFYLSIKYDKQCYKLQKLQFHKKVFFKESHRVKHIEIMVFKQNILKRDQFIGSVYFSDQSTKKKVYELNLTKSGNVLAAIRVKLTK